MTKYLSRSIIGFSAFISLVLFPLFASAGGDIRYDPPRPFSWHGAYAGLQIGYAWDEDSDIPNGATLQLNDGPLKYESIVGGVHLGYNMRKGVWVFGIEGDFELAPGDGDDGGRGADTNTLDTNWQASIRGRLGYLMRDNLLYITGGYAYLDADGKNDAGGQGDVSTNFHGWTVGAGMERILDTRTTVRFEYRYTDFDLEAENYSVAGYRLGFEPEIHTVRIGISARF